MKSFMPPAKHITLATLLAFLLATLVPAQSPSGAKPGRALNLLVLGDSISWGQGLRDEHKHWYLVKAWLEQNTGREVQSHVLAHSGAVIGLPDDPAGSSNRELDGELSRAYPTLNGQLDIALKDYADPSQIDLVLVDGCINDLDSRRLLNAVNTPDNIRELAQAKCGPPMEALLTRITNSFINASVVVTGYYPILSEKTANDLFIRTLAKRFYTPIAEAPRLNDKALRARLIAISREWYHTSDQMLLAAAGKVDAQLRAQGSKRRVLFADVGFAPEHSFAASKSRLWGFDASALRKFLVVLTLGRVQLRTNDERRRQRSDLCELQYAKQKNETPGEKMSREDRLMRCRLAAVGHPNRKGAAMYADAVGRLLRTLLPESGWLSKSSAPAPAGP
jgi:lysophospholipase L1-like esterase